MKSTDVKNIEKWASELDGVITMPDLKILFGGQSEAALFKKLESAVKDKVLIKVKRGIYALPGAPLEIISTRINPDSYISTGTVLASEAIIGSVPERRIQAVKIGRPRVYECETGIIEHLSISPDLFFGFETVKGIKYATVEKAFLDVCYFYYKGRRFSFDPESDVNINGLNAAVISGYLRKYDRRFVSFFRRIWEI
ncbi:MAG TPA: hypothetical protein DET40_15910 [Lentisphaeria bacterium]|nr:MAG: hypothetical protein A2X45_10565 [Lentisphaerae bacterium GWF2_50_93]HCE45026.1 hypothetical protein [Lentisphaeria bacterium]